MMRIEIALIPPKVLESVGSKLCIPDGVLYVLVAQVVLDRSGIVTVIGQFIARTVAQHMRMDGETNGRGRKE